MAQNPNDTIRPNGQPLYDPAAAAAEDDRDWRNYALYYKHNQQYAKPGPYVTKLTPQEESEFQNWVKVNKIPWQDTANADYDMRGYWKAQASRSPGATRAPNGHFPDTWKTPYGATFSN